MNPPASNPKHVFNCRDLAWVTPIKHWRLNTGDIPRMFYTHSFSLYWGSGLEIKLQQDTTDPESCPELSKLRELFINNIGYSYVTLDDITNIYIYKEK
jgi:hypothetical protein